MAAIARARRDSRRRLRRLALFHDDQGGGCSSRSQDGRRQGRRPGADPGHRRAGEEGGLLRLSERSRDGTAVPHRYRAQPCRRPDHQGPVQAGPDGEGGRYPRRNRSAALSGGARPGAVQEGAGRGQPEERAAQPRPLAQPGQEGLRHPAAGRHAAGDGRSADRPDPGRSGGDRQCPDAAQLHGHQVSAVGTSRVPPGRSGQHRARLRSERHRDDRAAATDLRGVHGAGRERAADQQGARGGNRGPGGGAELGRAADAGAGAARPRQQRGRPGERHHPHEGDLREQGQCAVAGPLGIDPPAGRHAEGRDRDSR